jgi:histone-lysine N-methyltransferase SETMAR
MDKIVYRAVIKFFVKEGLTPNEVHSKFAKFYGDSFPSFSTIKKWAAEFKRGRTSLEDDPREGRPKSAFYVVASFRDLGCSDLCRNMMTAACHLSLSRWSVEGLLCSCM